jgi:hypothetical protein
MKNWTIGRRIITGFAIILLMFATLGGLNIREISTLNDRIADIADNSLPSIFVLNEINDLGYNNFVNVLQMHMSSPEEWVEFEKKIALRK